MGPDGQDFLSCLEFVALVRMLAVFMMMVRDSNITVRLVVMRMVVFVCHLVDPLQDSNVLYAMHAAPKPLSIFTAATPGAQQASIEFNAVCPPLQTPYPIEGNSNDRFAR